jgi:hypothetical protein
LGFPDYERDFDNLGRILIELFNAKISAERDDWAR